MTSAANTCWRLLLACAASVPCFAAAQSTLGSACATFPFVYSQQQTVTLNQAAPPGQLVVISGVVDALAQLASDPVSDSVGNVYPITSVAVLAGSAGTLYTFAGRIGSALNSGSTVTISYFSTGSTAATSCVQVSVFPGVSVALPDDVYGTNNGTGSSWTVTASTPTLHANELVYSAFAGTGTPGTITALAPAQGLGGICNSGGTLCLQPVWNFGAASSGIYESADASAANSVAWGAQVIGFRSSERIFADGFD
jgi:hypothetical protein